MNAELNQNHETGNWIAFLFGVTFNLVSMVNLETLFDHVFQAVFGGVICLMFKIMGDVLSPLWEKYKSRIKDIVRKREREKRHED